MRSDGFAQPYVIQLTCIFSISTVFASRSLLTIVFTSLASAAPVNGTPVISEFLADNGGTLTDTEGRTPDWIEIHNPDNEAYDLGGHFLADSAGRWRFPENTILEPDGYLLVYARGLEVPTGAEGELNTSFRLNRDGEPLKLLGDDGSTVLSAFESVPQQREDISYGLNAGGNAGYFLTPTPGARNGLSVRGFVADTRFSVDRGFYDEPVSVEITTETENARILYTTDGSEPAEGSIFGGANGTDYTGPIEINSTTVLRAKAVKLGFAPTNVDSQTYIFLNDVLEQPSRPEGWPERWAGQPADYEMDPEVIGKNNLFNDAYRDTIREDLQSLPVMSVSLDQNHLFGDGGIYDNPQGDGTDWERPASVELFYPDGSRDGFQVTCGLRIQGGSSRSPNYPKHSFRLLFKKDYGPTKLRYALFADQPFGADATAEFDTIILRAGFNNSWTHWHWYQNPRAQYIRDQWMRDSQLAMGHPSPHGMFVHLYLNGLYWGLYNPVERPTAPFMAAYYGGEKEDFDTQNVNAARDGDLTAWNAMWSIANRGLTDDDNYADIQDYLDVVNLIDYLILNFYVGNDDWDGHNWYAGRRRAEGAGYQFFCWDSELIISRHQNNPPPPQPDLDIILNRNRTTLGSANKPTGLYNRLRANKEFQLLFADRIHKHLFNDGALTTEKILERWTARRDQVWRAVVAESARWGDYRRDVLQGSGSRDQYDLFHRNEHYVNYQTWLLETYFPQRHHIVLDQFRNGNLYPDLEAPRFNRHGGVAPGGFLLTILAGNLVNPASGSIYYTLDGSDPRLPGGEVSPQAQQYERDGEGLALDKTVTVKTRLRSLFGAWSALNEARFVIGVPAGAGNLVVSEIHYRPAPPTETETAAGFAASDFEFVELMNIEDEVITLTDVEFATGIAFKFATGRTLDPGARLVLVSNPQAFAFRYGWELPIAGTYTGRLNNGGETLGLVDFLGKSIVSFAYGDSDPWPGETDGNGPSLTLVAPETNPDPTDPAHWRASATSGGTPGDAEGDPFAQWQQTVFSAADLTDETISGALADPDKDKITNSWEFALGGDPMTSDTHILPQWSLEKHEVDGVGTAYLSVTYTLATAASGSTITAEISNDLRVWEKIDLVEVRSPEPLEDGRKRISMRDTASAGNAKHRKRYVRLRLQL